MKNWSSCLAVNKNERHAGSKGIAQVQSRDSCILCRCCSYVVGQDVHVVAKEPKSEVDQQIGSEDIVNAHRNALVPSQRLVC